MSNNSTEDIIGTLYDMVQDARSMPLAADKCILERDRVLDLLDEIIAQLPAEIKQSRTIVESRNELISQARREAEAILRQAQDQANELVAKEEIYKEAKKRSEELVAQTQERINQLRKAGKHFFCSKAVKIHGHLIIPAACNDLGNRSLAELDMMDTITLAIRQ